MKALKHFKRIHINGEYGYKQFALISLPDIYGDACVTLVRCKSKGVCSEMLRWGYFDSKDLQRIENLKRGQKAYLDDKSLVIRLS